jgi:kynurenine aminotransferase
LDYIPHHRIGTFSPELASRTITVGSAGKTFGCTGWRIGWLIGEPQLIKYATAAHTRVVFSCVSPLQEAVAVAFEKAEEHHYYEKTVKAYQERMLTLNKVWDELGLPYTIPQGGYFVMVNTAKVKMPEGYYVPEHVTKGRAKDFAMAYWLTKEIGVVAMYVFQF